MKRTLFSRVAAVALTLSMLIPCLIPVSAAEDPAVQHIYQYVAIDHWEATDDFRYNLFPSNTALRHESRDLWRIHRRYTPTLYTADGPKKIVTQGLQLGSSPIQQYSTDTRYSGRPSQVLNGDKTQVKILDGVRFELGGVEYPVITRGMSALNIAFDYMLDGLSEVVLGTADELRVFVSLDGETWLEDTVGIRSHKFLGCTTFDTNDKNTGMMYHLETENLFDIDGLEPGDRILNIMVEPLDKNTLQSVYLHLHKLDLNAYYSQEAFDRLVPADVREYVHVGEETMRQIVVDEGVRTASTPWTTDTLVYTSTPNGTTLGDDNFHFLEYHPGFTYHGPTYERDTDSTRELFQSQIDENGKWVGGYALDNTYGMDCQTFVFNAVSRVTPRNLNWAVMYALGAPGVELVGKDFLNLHDEVLTYTVTDIIPYNTDQEMFKSYALAKPGDMLVASGKGAGHVRVVVDNHVEYKPDGTIDGAKSYLIETEEELFPNAVVELADGTRTNVNVHKHQQLLDFLEANPGSKQLYSGSARADSKHSYNNLYSTKYAVQTCIYYPAGDIELERVETIFAPRTAGKSIQEGGVAISFASTYRVIGWNIKLEDLATGDVLYDYSAMSTVPHSYARLCRSDALDAKLASLTNGSYRLSCSVDAGPLTAIGQTKVPTTTATYDFTVTGKDPASQVSLSVPASAAKGETVEVLVSTTSAMDSADVDVKFDTAALTFKSAVQTDNIFVARNSGIVDIMAADAGIAAGGQLTKLTFTANTDIAKLSDVIQVKSALISTADEASAKDAAKAVNSTQACASINYGDVSENAWYHDAVDYALSNGVMSGYNAYTFGPDDKLSRAMVVQVLYNYEGKPAESSEAKFPDVKAADWYFNATRWGASKGVVSGYGNGNFGPNDNVTIEQVAVILHNYAGKPAAQSDLTTVGTYNDWAANALCWAEVNGILKSVPFTNATETATRAQTAQMLMNYLSK